MSGLTLAGYWFTAADARLLAAYQPARGDQVIPLLARHRKAAGRTLRSAWVDQFPAGFDLPIEAIAAYGHHGSDHAAGQRALDAVRRRHTPLTDPAAALADLAEVITQIEDDADGERRPGGLGRWTCRQHRTWRTPEHKAQHRPGGPARSLRPSPEVRA